MKDFAKIIRIVTVPPILVLSLLLILFYTKNSIFNDYSQLIVSIFLLAILPILAYPLQKVIPKYKDKGREGQRNLAFFLNFFGYALGVVYGYLCNSSKSVMLIFYTYFISVLLLMVINKVIKLRASGHACSITGPLILLVFFVGIKCILPCIFVFLLIIWSSVLLKRHSIKELILGTFTCIISFLVSYLIIF